jgi:hypothetical protein
MIFINYTKVVQIMLYDIRYKGVLNSDLKVNKYGDSQCLIK